MSIDQMPDLDFDLDTENEVEEADNSALAELEDLFSTPFPDQSWTEFALCAQTDPEAFFPEKGGSTRDAKKVCLSCPVRSECLEYALMNNERFGIWGGLSERERRKLRNQPCDTQDDNADTPDESTLD